ncbi:ABC transporter permease [Kribbella sp. CA-293567]|uniref:ABC transporter permease n=1 Tax=Kribbella sp. CA-293567 TaxID=3002436 RepID=UPI0022DCE70E|nr:ABC transporter permease [Kribbella sp. CA-293567]WBQ06234.1 ABC transporter permease [Kribbella sp. CA-293567]
MTALAWSEALLLRRNPLALLIAIGLPIFVVLGLQSSAEVMAVVGPDPGTAILITIAAVSLNLFVYYNLVSSLVARREELVLKRLRTGEATDPQILVGTAIPGVLIAWSQAVLAAITSALLVGLPVPVNLLLVLLALALGAAVFVLLAAATTVLTRSVEMAQLTTLPFLIVPLNFSGLYFPLSELPEGLAQLSRLLPLTPVVELLRLGLSGTTPSGGTVDLAGSFAPAVQPLLVLLAWVVVAGLATRRWFRWEPRR